MSAPEPPAPARESFLSLAPAALERRVTALGGRPFHARIALAEVYERGVLDFAEMTALPRALRERLAAALPLLAGREQRRVRSSDGTTKLLLSFARDDRAPTALVETVHIAPRRPERGKGATLCVSTQVGCPVGCPFCASGLGGLVRNLDAAEIVEQFLRGRSLGPLSRAVVMGIGEPLLNRGALTTALALVRERMGLGARRITVSTVGFPDRLRRLAPTRPGFQLAISLHTPDDAQRDAFVPAMAGTPIEAVLAAGDDWFEKTGREVTYECVLLGGLNDSRGHAERLATRLRGRRCTVNLIPYNPTGVEGFRRPAPATVEAYRQVLQAAGIVATVRWSRGVESSAACGQLRVRHLAR